MEPENQLIPGLSREMVLRAEGSRVKCSSSPSFRGMVKEGAVSIWSWTVQGSSSSVYDVRVQVRAGVTDLSSVGDLHVLCTCPDAIYQPTGRACKHAFACLLRAIDPRAEAAMASKRARQAEEIAKIKSGPLSAELERLEYGLSKANPESVIALLRNKLQSEEGVKLLSQVFTVADFPLQTKKYCTRCMCFYDPAYNTVCAIPHAEEDVTRLFKSMRGSKFECEACGKTWEEEGYSYFECISEESGACYRGPHQEGSPPQASLSE